METEPIIVQTSINYDVLSKWSLLFSSFIITAIPRKSTVTEVLKNRLGWERWPRARCGAVPAKKTD